MSIYSKLFNISSYVSKSIIFFNKKDKLTILYRSSNIYSL